MLFDLALVVVLLDCTVILMISPAVLLTRFNDMLSTGPFDLPGELKTTIQKICTNGTASIYNHFRYSFLTLQYLKVRI